MKIAIDAMGGDYAPEEIVKGAVIGAKEHGTGLILVGPTERIEKELAKYDRSGVNIEIVNTSEYLVEGEHPAYALRSMMDQFWGRIINISSLAGLVGNMGQANYSAAKGGLIAFTKSVAREVGSRNITANAIAPGFFTTEMTEKLPQETKDDILSRIPLKRFGIPDDVAELVAFLASERASYITAQVICIDGGVI